MINTPTSPAPTPTHRPTAIARSLWERINRSLTKRNASDRRKFWLGYVLALLQYHVIPMRDWRWLKTKIITKYGD